MIIKFIKKIWHDPVISKVIAIGIVAIIGYFGGIFTWIISIITILYYLINKSISISFWLLFLLVTFPIFSIAKFIKKIIINGDASKNNYKEYCQDVLLGIKWRWKYSSTDNKIYGLMAFCPFCDYQVYPHYTSSYQIIDNIGFKCDYCGKVLESYDFSYEMLEDRIIRMIQKYLRTGEWEKRIDHVMNND